MTLESMDMTIKLSMIRPVFTGLFTFPSACLSEIFVLHLSHVQSIYVCNLNLPSLLPILFFLSFLNSSFLAEM